MNFQRWGGRRFVLAVFVYVTSAALLWFGKLSDGSFCTIAMASVVSLIAGHTYEAVRSQEPKP